MRSIRKNRMKKENRFAKSAIFSWANAQNVWGVLYAKA